MGIAHRSTGRDREAHIGEEMTVRPEDTLRAAGFGSERQAKYQRQMSKLLAGRS